MPIERQEHTLYAPCEACKTVRLHHMIFEGAVYTKLVCLTCRHAIQAKPSSKAAEVGQ